MFNRQLFFVKQRIFYFVSFVLLDNLSSSRLRTSLLRLFGATVGKKCAVRGGLLIQEAFNFTMGDDVFVNAACCFDCSAPIILGDGVRLGYQLTIITGGHEIGAAECRAGAYSPKPVTIGDGAWIGARATVFSGVSIGNGAVVASGSVVTMDVKPHTLVAGVPARHVKTLEL